MGNVIVKYKNTLFFLLIFLLYLIMSVGIIKYNIITKPDINFLGIDEPRVLNDMFNITGDRINHYRTKVHPLFLILIQPVLHILNGFVHDLGITVAVGQSIAGITIIISLFHILKFLRTDYFTAVLLTTILSFSFSQIMFVSNPESFIWGGMSTALCWLFVVSQIEHPDRLFSGRLLHLFIFTGVLCFGVTITNYIQFIVALVFVLRITAFPIKKKIDLFIKTNFYCLGVATLLNVLQYISWRHETELWVKQFYTILVQKLIAVFGTKINTILPFYNDISRDSFEEARYMDFTVSLTKVSTLIDQVLGSSILSRPLLLSGSGSKYHTIFFDGSYSCAGILLGTFFVLLFLSCLLYYFKSSERDNSVYKLLQMLIVAFLLNILLHFVYGFHEAFMYTPHFLFMFFIIFGIASKCWSDKQRRCINLFFLIFILYEVMINLQTYSDMRLFLMEYLGTPPYSMIYVSSGVFALILLFAILLYKGYEIHPSFFLAKSKYLLSVNAAYDMMLVYSSVCLLSAAFVYFAVFTEYAQ